MRWWFTVAVGSLCIAYLLLIVVRNPINAQYAGILCNFLLMVAFGYCILDRFPTRFGNGLFILFGLLGNYYWLAAWYEKIRRKFFSSPEELNRFWEKRLWERRWARIDGYIIHPPDRVITIASFVVYGLLVLIFLWCVLRIYSIRRAQKGKVS